MRQCVASCLVGASGDVYMYCCGIAVAAALLGAALYITSLAVAHSSHTDHWRPGGWPIRQSIQPEHYELSDLRSLRQGDRELF